MTNLYEDLSILTNIAITNLNALVRISDNIISHAVLEDIIENNQITEINIGIGMLKILHTDTEIKYKFIPSEQLNNKIITTMKTNESSLIRESDKSLNERIRKTYKDLF